MRMHKMIVVVVGLVLAGASARGAITGVVNVDMQRTAAPATTLYSGQGAYSDPGNNYWNPYNATLLDTPITNLWTSTQLEQTTVDFAFTPLLGDTRFMGGNNGTPTGPYANLLANYALTFGTMDAVISGLIAGNAYDLYLYSTANGQHQGARFTIGGDTRDVEGGPGVVGTPTSFIAYPTDDSNYTLYSGVVADGFGSITFNMTNYQAAAALNGFQIVGTFLPEPSTAMLLGLGGLLLRRRRRYS